VGEPSLGLSEHHPEPGGLTILPLRILSTHPESDQAVRTTVWEPFGDPGSPNTVSISNLAQKSANGELSKFDSHDFVF